MFNYKEEQFGDLDYNFTVTEQIDGKNKTINLIENAEQTFLTKENFRLYIEKYVEYKLEKSISEQMKAIRESFLRYSVYSSYLDLILPSDLKDWIVGKFFSLSLLKSCVKYHHCNQYSPIIIWLWEILESSSFEFKKDFLKYGKKKIIF